MASTDAGRRRQRVRRAVSFLLLAIGWIAIVATSPPRTSNVLEATLHVPNAAVRGGDVELVVAENDAAASVPEPGQPLLVEVSASVAQQDADGAPDASLRLPTGEELEMRRGTPGEEGVVRFVIPWSPDPCTSACIHTAVLSVDHADAMSTEATWDVRASIVYGFDSNGVPKDAGLVIGLRREGSSNLLTTNTAGGVLPTSGVLLTTAHPRAHQTLELEVPRNAIPAEAIQGDVAHVVWKGGALRTLASGTDAKAQVILTPQGEIGSLTVPVDGTASLFQGTSSVYFELPFVLDCTPDRCVGELQADFELLEGSWFVLDWSNTVSGLSTTEGVVWIPGWHLRVIAP